MKKDKLVRILASLVDARLNCIKANNKEWEQNHTARAIDIVNNLLPSGSGIDNGTKIDFEHSTGEKLVFYTSYHHMNDGGYYDGWTEHTITARPSFVHIISLSISGRDRNDTKEYLAEIFNSALTQLIEWNDDKQTYVRSEVTL